MGFFDFVKPLATLAAGTFLGATGATAVSSLFGDDETVQKTGGTGVRPITLDEAKEAQRTGVVPGGLGTGAMRKRTIVQTIDAKGNIVKSKITKGGVAVFQADVTAANRVARQVRKLDKRMPRKLVKQSEIARLKDEVTEQALRDARDHGHGHNGHCPT